MRLPHHFLRLWSGPVLERAQRLANEKGDAVNVTAVTSCSRYGRLLDVAVAAASPSERAAAEARIVAGFRSALAEECLDDSETLPQEHS